MHKLITSLSTLLIALSVSTAVHANDAAGILSGNNVQLNIQVTTNTAQGTFSDAVGNPVSNAPEDTQATVPFYQIGNIDNQAQRFQEANALRNSLIQELLANNLQDDAEGSIAQMLESEEWLSAQDALNTENEIKLNIWHQVGAEHAAQSGAPVSLTDGSVIQATFKRIGYATKVLPTTLTGSDFANKTEYYQSPGVSPQTFDQAEYASMGNNSGATGDYEELGGGLPNKGYSSMGAAGSAMNVPEYTSR